MGYADPFLLGPLGRMVALPSPVAAGFPAPYERIAAEHRSLRGGTTLDVLGAYRSWEFPFEWRHDNEAARLIARWTSPLVNERLRLIDPMTPNRFSLDLASGCGVTAQPVDVLAASVDDFVQVVVPLTRPALLDGLLERAVRWSPGTAATDLYLGVDNRVPVSPGETLTFQCWAKGDATVTPAVRCYTAAGATSDTVGSPVALSSSWAEISVDTTIAAGQVSAVAALHVEAGAAGRIVDVTGLSMGPAADLPAGQWLPGGGAPVVVLAGFDHAYQRLGRHQMTLTVREA